MLGHAGDTAMTVLIVPKKGERIVTEGMKEKGLDRDAYRLGKHDGIRDCIHYLKQQGYVVEEYDSEKHG